MRKIRLFLLLLVSIRTLVVKIVIRIRSGWAGPWGSVRSCRPAVLIMTFCGDPPPVSWRAKARHDTGRKRQPPTPK